MDICVLLNIEDLVKVASVSFVPRLEATQDLKISNLNRGDKFSTLNLKTHLFSTSWWNFVCWKLESFWINQSHNDLWVSIAHYFKFFLADNKKNQSVFGVFSDYPHCMMVE